MDTIGTLTGPKEKSKNPVLRKDVAGSHKRKSGAPSLPVFFSLWEVKFLLLSEVQLSSHGRPSYQQLLTISSYSFIY